MMPKRTRTISTDAVGTRSPDGRLFFPSATRNADAIVLVLASYVPPTGGALEIASDSGQHTVRHARAFPRVAWQPSEIDPAKIASIECWRREAVSENLAAPIELDATASEWATGQEPFDLILIVNLLHLIGAHETTRIATEIARALTPGGALLVYGPFLREDRFASVGDKAFNRSLFAQDPAIAYKFVRDVRNM